MRKAGIDKDVARTIVGHKTDNMARRYQIYDAGEKEAALTQLQAYLSVVESKGKTGKSGRTLSDGWENEMKPVQNPYILAKINLSEFVSAFESISGG